MSHKPIDELVRHRMREWGATCIQNQALPSILIAVANKGDVEVHTIVPDKMPLNVLEDILNYCLAHVQERRAKEDGVEVETPPRLVH